MIIVIDGVFGLTTSEISFISEKFNRIYIVDIDVCPDIIGEKIYVDIIDTTNTFFKRRYLHTNVLRVLDSEYLICVVYDLIIDYIKKKHRKILLELRRTKLLNDTKNLLTKGEHKYDREKTTEHSPYEGVVQINKKI